MFAALVSAVLFCSAVDAQTASSATPTAGPAKQVYYGLVVDNSGSLRTQLEIITDIVKDVVADNGADDQAFLIRFISSDKISLRQDFTTDKELLNDAADAMYIEGGHTAMLDAINIAADHFAARNDIPATAAKALLVITDGDDRESSSRVDDLLAKLKKSEIRVFAIGVSDLKVETKLLDKLTKGTGGKLILYRRRDAAQTAAKEVAAAMRAR